MSRVKFEDFEKGLTKNANIFEVNLGNILLVEDIKIGGYTAFFQPDRNIISEGETKEEAVINLLSTYSDVLASNHIKLNVRKIST